MTKLPIPFAIRSIETLEFATIKEAYKDDDSVGLETGFNFGINREEHLLVVQFSSIFKCEERPFIKLKVACKFDIEVKSFEKFKDNETEKIVVPKGFFTHLAVLTVGTARGVLHARLDNTGFDEFILPTLNISDIIDKDIVFDAQKDI